MNKNQNFDRAIFEKLSSKFPNRVIAPSYLRLEQLLANNKSVYKFEVRNDNQTQTPTENRIDRNDLFFATEMSLGLIKVVAGEHNRAVVQTYPNQIVFPAAAGFDPADLEVIYNGKLSYKVGTKAYIDAMDTRRFRFVPETQQSAATNHSEFSEGDGFSQMNPFLNIKGWENTELQLSIPTDTVALEIAGLLTDKHYVVLMAKGFIVKDAIDKSKL